MARLPEDPTFELIEKAGGNVETSKEGHAVADGTVWVSGEIPRVSEFEGGLLGGVRWISTENEGKGGWIKEEVCTACFVVAHRQYQLAFHSISWKSAMLASTSQARVL